MNSLREDADRITEGAIAKVLPDAAVRKALEGKSFPDGRVILVAIGKAAWQMAKAAHDVLGDDITEGMVITKYDHVKGPIADFSLYEAGHPVPDENTYKATQAVIDKVSDLSENDTVIFLISGGGSALFEKPLCKEEELKLVTEELLASGASITEINTIRKRLSAVKRGRFAKLCMPAKFFSIVLSDIIGDPLDMIASGPAYPDRSTCEDAIKIAKKHGLTLSKGMEDMLMTETPKELSNVTTIITGSVRELCNAAADEAMKLGYEPVILTDCLSCEASEAGKFLGAIAKSHSGSEKSLAFIAGGETVVHLKGKGKGGRNQEIALSAAIEISGLKNTAVFSVGSDGTDGPTDAAGGYADGDSVGTPNSKLTIEEAEAYLNNNDAYEALRKTEGLIMTGPTGTNVNDVSIVIIKR